MENKPHLSSSQLSMFSRCAEQYRRRYIENEKQPPAIAQLKGSAIHTSAQENFKRKLKTRKDLKRADIIDIAIETFEQNSKGEVFLSQEERSIGLKKLKAEAKDRIVLMANVFAQKIAPEYMPVLVEETQTIEVPGSSYDLVAVLDLYDEKERVVDWKTGTRKKQQSEADFSEQLSFYALVVKAKTGRMPKELILENIIDTGERQMLKTRRSKDDLQVLLNRLNVMIKALKAGIFMPTNPTNWWCNPRFCGFYTSCNYVSK